MKVDAISPTLLSDASAGMKSTAAVPSSQESKLGKACDQFEGMLVRQIMSEGMKPLLAKPLGGSGEGGGVYDYMVTDTLANSVAGKNGMGISHLLQAQLGPHKHSTGLTPHS